jgi:hypothetical protein
MTAPGQQALRGRSQLAMGRLRSMSRGCRQNRLEYGENGGAGAVRCGRTGRLYKHAWACRCCCRQRHGVIKQAQQRPSPQAWNHRRNSHRGRGCSRRAELDHPASVMPFAVACLPRLRLGSAALPSTAPAALDTHSATLTHASPSGPASAAVHKMEPLSGHAVRL